MAFAEPRGVVMLDGSVRDAQRPRWVGADHVQRHDLAGIRPARAIVAVAAGTGLLENRLASFRAGGHDRQRILRRLEAQEVGLDVAEGRFEGLELLQRLLAQQELHVRPDRGRRRAARDL